jgi:hypothetical protein
MKKKKELSNPARFWAGAVMGLFELVGVTIWGLNQLSWKWLTENVVMTIFCISAVVLYNILAGMLVLNGSKK